MDIMVMGPNAVLTVTEHEKGNWILNGGFFFLHFVHHLC